MISVMRLRSSESSGESTPRLGGGGGGGGNGGGGGEGDVRGKGKRKEVRRESST